MPSTTTCMRSSSANFQKTNSGDGKSTNGRDDNTTSYHCGCSCCCWWVVSSNKHKVFDKCSQQSISPLYFSLIQIRALFLNLFYPFWDHIPDRANEVLFLKYKDFEEDTVKEGDGRIETYTVLARNEGIRLMEFVFICD